MEDERLKACLEYFRARPVYKKIFVRFREKTVSLGHFGGSVVFASLSDEEKQQLEGFLQKNYRGQKSLTISAALLQKSLESSRFAGLDWEQILEAYFGEPLVGKKELDRRMRQEREEFFRKFYEEDKENSERERRPDVTSALETAPMPGHVFASGIVPGIAPARRWLQTVVEESGPGVRLLLGQYKEDKERLETALNMLIRASETLPADAQTFEPLPVFSARITGNPHYFDVGTFEGNLLEAFLSDRYECRKEPGLAGAEWKNRVLYQAGILRDALSNHVMLYGIGGVNKNGMVHEGLEGFLRAKEPVVATLLTLGGLAEVKAAKEVYVVENPAVFSELIRRRPEGSFVCSNGQPRLAALVLLDLLKIRSTLWYAGDFDPEGLVIAQNLKQRYGADLLFWDYRIDYYRRAMSEVRLDEKRLGMLDRVREQELRDIAQEIRTTGHPAYQETMLEWAYQL